MSNGPHAIMMVSKFSKVKLSHAHCAAMFVRLHRFCQIYVSKEWFALHFGLLLVRASRAQLPELEALVSALFACLLPWCLWSIAHTHTWTNQVHVQSWAIAMGPCESIAGLHWTASLCQPLPSQLSSYRAETQAVCMCILYYSPAWLFARSDMLRYSLVNSV